MARPIHPLATPAGERRYWVVLGVLLALVLLAPQPRWGSLVLGGAVVAFVGWRWRDAERGIAQRVRASEEQFRLTFEYAPMGVTLVGLDGVFLRVNPALGSMLGYDPSELVGRTFQSITHPDDLDADLELLGRCLTREIDGYQMAKRYLHRAGHELWVELSVAVAHDSTGAPSHFVAQVVDLTERRAAAASLANTQARFAALVEHGSDLISVTDVDGRLLYASPAHRTVLGFDPGDRLGEPLQNQIHPDDRQAVLDAGLELTGTPGGSATLQFRFAHADGSWRWVEATLTNRLDDPAVQGFVTNTRDVNDRVLATERLAYEASHDALTGLPDRTLLKDRLIAARALARSQGSEAVALFVDIDYFKAVNDSYGHAAGDQLLVDVADRLRGAARGGDEVFRMGGDEFVLIATVDGDGAATLATRTCQAFAEPFLLGDVLISVTASVGMATTAEVPDDSKLLHAADVALYEAKRAGRNRWIAYRLGMQGAAQLALSVASEGDARGAAQRWVTERFRSQIVSSREAMLVHVKGVIVAASPAAARLVDAEDEQSLIGLSVATFLTPETRVALGERARRQLEAGGWPQPEVIEVSTLSGRVISLEIASTPTLWEGAVGAQIALRAPGAHPSEATSGVVAGGLSRADATLLRELEAGITAGQIELAYQPIVDGAGNVVKVEALVRWHHPTLGTLMPGSFVPQAESADMMARLTGEVLRQACAQVATWRRDGDADLELAVNISGRELSDDGLVDRVLSALAWSGLPATALWLEITETALTEDAARAGDGLARLCGLGVRIALDDFGTGFATLAQLHQFPAHALKVDRLFVDGLVERDPGDTAIVRSVLALGRELGLVVIAEGVELEQQRDMLVGMGCDLFQGYLFARPAFAVPRPPWLLPLGTEPAEAWVAEA